MIFGTFFKMIRIDNARDYINENLSTFFKNEGIAHELSYFYTLQQNRVAKCKNKHLLNVSRAILFQNKVLKNYWGEAILTVTFLINRIPSRTFDN